jgi:hypothetical protein
VQLIHQRHGLGARTDVEWNDIFSFIASPKDTVNSVRTVETRHSPLAVAVAERLRRAIPLLGQGGVAAPLLKCREASLAGADGVVRPATNNR